MPPPAPAGRTQYTGHLAREQTRAPLRPQRQLTAASGENDPRLTIDRPFMNNKGDTHHDYNGQLHFLSFVNNTNKKIIQTNKQAKPDSLWLSIYKSYVGGKRDRRLHSGWPT